ncbi:MAG: response regulator [Pseudomonadota bacterium]
MSQQIRLSQRQLRLAVLSLALVPAITLLIFLMVSATQIRLQDDLRQLESSAQQTVEQLAASTDYALMSNQPALISTVMMRVAERPEVAALRIHDASGRLWWQERPRVVEKKYAAEDLRHYSAVVVTPALSVDPDDWLSVDAARPSPEKLGEVHLWIATDIIVQHERSILIQIGMLGFCALLLIFVIAWWIAERVLARYALLAYDEQRQRVISQDLMRQADKHWRTEQALQTRWGKWSHDVRTPLHGVSGLLELLDTTPLDAEQQAYVRSAREAAGALEQNLRNNPLADVSEQLDGLNDLALQRAQESWRGRRILLLEDDPVSAHLMTTLLQSWGVRLTCVSTGHAGLQALQQSWDLILLDGELPDYNAAEWWCAMELLPESTRARQGPIVVITAHDDDEHLALFQRVGFDPVLIKPVRGRQLLSVLTPLLRVH